MTALLLFLTLSASGEVFISSTGVYQPLNRSQTAITPGGQVFVLDRRNCQILGFDPDGNLDQRFSRRGEGPGELIAPLYIGCRDKKIWVFDSMRSGVSWFDLNGRYLETYVFQDLTTFFYPTEKGWAFLKSHYGKSLPASIYMLDQTMERKDLVFKWTPEWMSPDRVWKRHEISRNMGINPAKEFIHFVSDEKGRFLYLAHTGPKFRISVIDTRKKKVARTIKRNLDRVPFNREWGRGQIRASNSLSKSGFQGKLDAPDYFPLIKWIQPHGENLLVVELWTMEPDLKRRFLVMDQHGRDVSLPFRPENVGRILGYLGDEVYLSGFNPGPGEATVLKTRKTKIDEAVVANPIEYEDQRGEFIMIDL